MYGADFVAFVESEIAEIDVAQRGATPGQPVRRRD